MLPSLTPPLRLIAKRNRQPGDHAAKFAPRRAHFPPGTFARQAASIDHRARLQRRLHGRERRRWRHKTNKPSKIKR